MSRRFYSTGIALGLLGVVQSVGQAQSDRIVVLAYQNAPLTGVIRGFAAFSQAPIVVAPEVGNPDVTVALWNVDWRVALDFILDPLSLVARNIGADGIRIEKSAPVDIQWNYALLSNVLRGFAAVSGRSIVLAPGTPDTVVTAAFRGVDWERALGSVLEQVGLIARVESSGVIRVEKKPN